MYLNMLIRFVGSFNDKFGGGNAVEDLWLISDMLGFFLQRSFVKRSLR